MLLGNVLRELELEDRRRELAVDAPVIRLRLVKNSDFVWMCFFQLMNVPDPFWLVRRKISLVLFTGFVAVIKTCLQNITLQKIKIKSAWDVFLLPLG